MKRSLASILVPTVLTLVGCATPYQPHGWTGGYSDFRISKNTFEVSFSGNGYTGRQRVSRYVLRRASEIALAHGFTHFEPLSETSRTDTPVYSNQGNTQTYLKPSNTTRIRCVKNPTSTEYLINAREFLRYNFPKALEDYPDEPTENPEEVEDG